MECRSLAYPKSHPYIIAGTYRYCNISKKFSVLYTSKRYNIQKCLPISKYIKFNSFFCQLAPGEEMILRFLRHLLPIILPSHSSSTSGYVMKKVQSDLDYFLPFRQHAPSLANARREIYADVHRLANPTGIGLFNILAFRGVFFGSPFAKSNHFRWFCGYEDWEGFMIDGKEEARKDGRIEEEYYVKQNCYGHSQKERSTNLLEGYWKQRNLWNEVFNQSTKPNVRQVYRWLTSTTEEGKSKFRNIGSLSALLICGDLVEAGLVLTPSSRELGDLIFKVGKGAKDGMTLVGLVKNSAKGEELCEALESLDLALLKALSEEEKEAMGYNIIMLEHTLCKIKRLMKGISLPLLRSEIN